MAIRGKMASGVAVFLGVLLVSAAVADEQPEVMQGRQDAVVRPWGDADSALVITPSLATYTKIKQATPNPYVLYRMLSSGRAKWEMRNLKAEYDDATHSLKVAGTMAGAAVCRNGSWRLEVEPTDKLLMAAGTKVALTSVMSLPDGETFTANSVYELPAGATDIRLDGDTHSLVYKMDYEKHAGASNVECQLRVKARIMAALYKIYASPDVGMGSYWVGKATIRNTGDTPIRNLRISYMLGEYCDWSVPSEYDVVLPQGTVVEPFYPILPSRVNTLRSDTPVELRLKYEYEDGNGQKVVKEAAGRLKILGVTTFLYSDLTRDEDTGSWQDFFSNSPLVAAFVTKNDPPIVKLAGMASQLSGGAGASLTDKEALAYLEALYNLEAANGLSYQTAAGLLLDRHELTQEIKYPRDVLRDKAGTCIHLAITYAAAAEAVGLEANLALIPGHCYPIIKLPQSGNLVAVETTCVEGPGKAATFDHAVKAGAKEAGELDNQDHFLINLHEMWQQGVPVPELPAVPDTCLKDWGWVMPEATRPPQGEAGQQQPAEGGEGQGQGHDPAPVPAGGAFMGAIVVPLSAEDQQALGIQGGAAVQALLPGGPAERAGMERMDVLLALGGTNLTGPDQVVTILAASQPGAQLKASVWRHGQTMQMTITLEAKPEGVPGQ